MCALRVFGVSCLICGQALRLGKIDMPKNAEDKDLQERIASEGGTVAQDLCLECNDGTLVLADRLRFVGDEETPIEYKEVPVWLE
jgi:hypothetical protein